MDVYQEVLHPPGNADTPDHVNASSKSTAGVA
jgi:hypothetical protein